MISSLAHSRVIKSLGLVFGDIGTSPIYTISIILLVITPTEENIFGVISLIFWSLFLVISIQYVWLAMSISSKGEGGTIVLKEVLLSHLEGKKFVPFISFLAIIGICLFMGDGVITPAISILSAVEGIRLIPGMEAFLGAFLITIAAIIAIALFSIQRHGTDRLSRLFGPIMLIWFASLSITGLIALFGAPHILLASSLS